MALSQVVVKGRLNADGRLELDEKPNMPAGPVEVRLMQIPELNPKSAGVLEVLEQIWREQDARGYQRRTMQELEADEAQRRADNEAYEERWRQIWAQTTNPTDSENQP